MSEATGFTTFKPMDKMLEVLRDDIHLLSARQMEMDERITELENCYSEEKQFYTIREWAQRIGADLTRTLENTLMKWATELSIVKGVSIEIVEDARYGVVNSYHKSILEEALGVGDDE